ncbi:VOC family protein [Arhodomonas sp. AD133]|uniref:VOC family protein n=1 Tax=Arhodomonas sp. AD133 TaxID=3415009 RepID=UPI003EBFD677
MDDLPHLEAISAITLFTADMSRAVRFYEALGFRLRYGGERSEFTSFHVGPGYLNLMNGAPPERPWGRAILYVSDVDGMHQRAVAAGLGPETDPTDAPWGERYFHLRDPDGHELSFARPLDR